MFLAEVSRGVNMKKPESELHSGSEQQGEEPGCADQPPPAAVRVEMRPRADIVYVWTEGLPSLRFLVIALNSVAAYMRPTKIISVDCGFFFGLFNLMRLVVVIICVCD